MLRKIKKFSQLSTQERNLFMEAYYTLGFMRAAILSVPFKKLTHSLEHQAKKSEVAELSDEQKNIAISIGKAIEQAAQHTPWESACLVQALTAHKMLKKYSIPGVFYLGVAKDKNTEEKMKAHAWSQAGDAILTGARGHESFTVVSAFGWRIA